MKLIQTNKSLDLQLPIYSKPFMPDIIKNNFPTH